MINVAVTQDLKMLKSLLLLTKHHSVLSDNALLFRMAVFCA